MQENSHCVFPTCMHACMCAYGCAYACIFIEVCCPKMRHIAKLTRDFQVTDHYDYIWVLNDTHTHALIISQNKNVHTQ